MIINYILTLSLPPLIALLIILYQVNRHGRGFYESLFPCFLLGMFSVILVVAFQYIASYTGLDISNFRRMVFYALVIMGFGSELGKFLVLRYYGFNLRNFDGPADAIMYSAIISMGFSLASNMLYFIIPVYQEIDFLYAYTVIAANLVFAIILGFFVGLAKKRENRFVDSMTGLLAASFFHALYNFCFFMKDFKLLVFLSIGVVVVVVLLLIKTYNLEEEDRKLKAH